ncbi:MAG: nitrate reductase [Deltaproteobacteria bacterium]|nr:nitrate reductase [Deltaproteobacteria bacterium]
MYPYHVPLVWTAFIALFAGLSYRLVSMARLAAREKTVLPTLDAKYGARSILHWVIPFNSRNMRMRPLFTVVSFAFHICLLATPLLLMGHAVLWKTAWGLRWWSLPPVVADATTLVVIAGGVFFLLRRIAAPEVRKVTAVSDFLLVLLVISPFLTGFVARMQWFRSSIPYSTMITIHIVAGALWLAAIPFTRLSHMLWFVFSRAYMGSEFGAIRRARDW